MTKRLDPEIKTLRAIARLLSAHDQPTKERVTWYFYEAVRANRGR